MTDLDNKKFGCPSCNRWRSKAFDGLDYLSWFDKADIWGAAGRQQRRCKSCHLYQWMKKTKGAER